MVYQILDLLVDEIVEIDELDLVGIYDQGDGRTILENADGLLFETYTSTVEALGITIE